MATQTDCSAVPRQSSETFEVEIRSASVLVQGSSFAVLHKSISLKLLQKTESKATESVNGSFSE